MVKRILDLHSSMIDSMTKDEKLKSIRLAEGRTIMAEIICIYPPVLGDVSNAELASAFGADIILLNMYDVNNPMIYGINKNHNPIRELKRLTGKMIGVNLEPVDESNSNSSVTKGRQATIENIKKLIEQDADMVVLTGNPSTKVSNNGILSFIKEIKDNNIDELIIVSGKMHGAGHLKDFGNNIINEELAIKFIEAGTDILLLPAPATVPGIDIKRIQKLVEIAHEKKVMAMTCIGTSQEGSNKEVIQNIALWSKMAGSDIHHIGDCGMSPGVASPENIMDYSIAIRGKRHTYRIMSRSINR